MDQCKLMRNPSHSRRQNPVAAITDVITAAPAGPGNTWTLQDALQAGCCVFADGQSAYLTCDPQTTGNNHPLHGLEVQVQQVHEGEGSATVCHQIFNEGCWKLPLCSDANTPSTCCVRLGQFPKGGLTFTGIIECSDISDPLHGMHVMTGDPYQKNGKTYVSFDVGGDVSAELPVCPSIQARPIPTPSDCCVKLGEFPKDGLTFTGIIVCTDPNDPLHGVHVMTGQPYQKDGKTYVSFDVGGDVQEELPVCPEPPPWGIPPTKEPPPPQRPRPPKCCVDATTTPPTLQQCSDPSYNGTPVDILDVDEAAGSVLVKVPWSSSPIQMPLCPGPDEECPPCPPCPTCPPGTYLDTSTGKCVTCPPPEECPPGCPPGYWTAPDGSCVQCPPGYLIDPTTGECVTCPEGEECPPCPPCPSCPPCPPGRPCPDDPRPPWECCDEDEDCVPSATPRLPHFPQPRPVPGCDPDDPCCYECRGAGTVSNPCNACRAGRR
jgi:hypothetical protein